MNDTTFQSILDKPSNEIERPKPLPAGSYVCVIQGMPKFDKSSKKGTPYVEFTLKPIQAGDDVDAEALQEMGGLGEKTLRGTFYITEDAAWRLTDFLDHAGAGDESMTPRQRIDETPGKQVIANIRHKASADGSSVYAELGNTAPVE